MIAPGTVPKVNPAAEKHAKQKEYVEMKIYLFI